MALLKVGPAGCVGMHQAACRQVLVVLEGEARVSTRESEPMMVHVGQAVVFEAGEWHQTTTDTGLTALVIEGEGLEEDKRTPV